MKENKEEKCEGGWESNCDCEVCNFLTGKDTPQTPEWEEEIKEIIYSKDVDWEWDIPGDTVTYHKIHQLYGKIRQALSQAEERGRRRGIKQIEKILDSLSHHSVIGNVHRVVIKEAIKNLIK